MASAPQPLQALQDPVQPSLCFDTEGTILHSDEVPTARSDGGPDAGQAKLPAAPPIRRLAIVIRDDAFDRLLTPLTFAWEMGRKGVEVDILFVLWSVRLLTQEGARESRMDPRYAHREDWLKQRRQRDGDPFEIHDFFKLLASTGLDHNFAHPPSSHDQCQRGELGSAWSSASR